MVTTAYSLGVSTGASGQQTKVKTAEEIAQQRKNEVFGGASDTNIKRSREDYAVKLRKERR